MRLASLEHVISTKPAVAYRSIAYAQVWSITNFSDHLQPF